MSSGCDTFIENECSASEIGVVPMSPNAESMDRTASPRYTGTPAESTVRAAVGMAGLGCERRLGRALVAHRPEPPTHVGRERAETFGTVHGERLEQPVEQAEPVVRLAAGPVEVVAELIRVDVEVVGGERCRLMGPSLGGASAGGVLGVSEHGAHLDRDVVVVQRRGRERCRQLLGSAGRCGDEVDGTEVAFGVGPRQVDGWHSRERIGALGGDGGAEVCLSAELMLSEPD